jgi:hypothetical protein
MDFGRPLPLPTDLAEEAKALARAVAGWGDDMHFFKSQASYEDMFERDPAVLTKLWLLGLEGQAARDCSGEGEVSAGEVERNS